MPGLLEDRAQRPQPIDYLDFTLTLPKRMCAKSGCLTVLSHSNRSDLCRVHQAEEARWVAFGLIRRAEIQLSKPRTKPGPRKRTLAEVRAAQVVVERIKPTVFSVRLNKLRKGSRLTMERMALMLGVHRNTVSLWCNGVLTPSDAQRTRIEKLLARKGDSHGRR